MGVFFVTLLPQFVPAGVAVAPFIALLVAIYVKRGGALVGARDPHGALDRPLDRGTGVVLIGAGLRLAAEGRR